MVREHHWLNEHEFEQTPGEDRGVWCATFHRISKSWAWLSDWTTRGKYCWQEEKFLHMNLHVSKTSRSGKCFFFYYIKTVCVCVCVCMCECVLIHVRLFATPWTIPVRILWPLDFPGKNTRVGYHFLLQGIFMTQGSNPHLLPVSLSLAGRFFTTWDTWEAQTPYTSWVTGYT